MSVVTETAATTWQEKKDRAAKLMAEVKQLNSEGIDNGDKAEKAHQLVAEAQRLAGEYKAEKLEEDKSRLTEIVKAYEAQPEPSASYTPGPLVAAPKAGAEDDGSDMFAPGNQKMVVTRQAAEKNLAKVMTKALNEGATGAGGFLVVPEYMQNLFAETRRQGNSLRRYGWLAVHSVDNTNTIYIPQGSGAATFGIVAENATKPSADQAYTQLAITIFTAAGISKVSKQLVLDSNPTAADLVSRELGTLAGNLEEQKIINGSGTGEPRGILNTSGINTITATATTAQLLVDQIIDAIAQVQQNYFAAPTGILMHPRRLAYLQKAKDTSNNYIFTGTGQFRAPGGLGGTTGVTSQSENSMAVLPTLLGVQVGVSSNVPVNLTGSTDAVIVANWNEAHFFQSMELTLDTSDVAGTAFETNQVWFRLEERFGFTAARYPAAFSVITGNVSALQ